MSPITAKIRITGLAYFHLADQGDGMDELQVLFLHPDSRHELTMNVLKEQPALVSQFTSAIHANSHIKVSAKDAVSVSPGGTVFDFKEMVNIDSLHGGDPEHLPFRSKPAIGLSYLSIPNIEKGNVKTTAKSGVPMEFWRIDGAVKNHITALDREIGTEFGVEFDVTGAINFQFSEKVPGTSTLLATGTYTVQPPWNYTITFDNTCPGTLCVSDFRYYYKILDGTNKAGHEIEFEELVPFDSAGSMAEKDREAACNPANGDPPPGCTMEEYLLSLCP